MHRCLLIPEILRIICVHISTHHQSRDLLAVALVCRGFYNTSLDLLWRQIYGLLPLVRCLPSDIWSGPPANYNVVLARAIAPPDLERFRAHAHHVQVYHNHYTDVPITIYQALNFHFHDQPIFPNLVEIVWRSVKSEVFPYISMFLGPRIRKMELYISGDPIQNSLLLTLGKRCPSLIHFNLYPTMDCYLDIGRQIKPLLSQWSQLETLEIHCLSEESLQIVAGLPHLRGLILSQVDDDYGNTFSPIPGTKVFPVLQNLSIRASSPILCINLLKAATNCPLKKFTFSLFGLDPPVWHDLFATLGESCNKGTLTTINIDDLAAEHEHWTPGTTDELRFLFLFTSLTCVSLRTCYGFDIDDAFMGEIATAWPHIRILDIGAIRIIQPFQPQQLTLHGLAPLAELCPELKDLTVHVNVAHMCSNHFNLCPGSKSHVEYLDVGRSPILEKSIPWTAAYLSVMFPKLREVDSDHRYIEGDTEPNSAARWSEVRNHLVAYRYVSGHRRDNSHCTDCESDTM
ncbi:hypothetical protein BD779DRAFT_1786293 [Infundibulicybe gibba]|nr:hypothetical protein BD779DRAFT_1786293 [Infundibulicybe gibba]